MNFFFKRKPIHLDCFTSTPNAYDFAPIETASNFLPEWWKRLPKTAQSGAVMDAPTIKGCAGLVDLYTKGVMLPIWSDLDIAIRPDFAYEWKFADAESKIDVHPFYQTGSFLLDIGYVHMKIVAPWRFSCKEDIDWHFAQPVWNQEAARDYCVPSGVLNFKYQTNININMLFRGIPNNIHIPHGHPMAHIIPLSERPVKVHNHFVTEEELRRHSWRSTSFRAAYYKQKKLMQEKESKCPFGFKGGK
jgi:hypothetical protein